MMLWIFLFIASVFLAGNVMSVTAVATDGEGSDFIVATTNQALRSIKSAEAAGADVSDLIARFNVAIDLQQQAENGSYKDCPSYNECIVRSNNMLLTIVEDATTLGNQATSSTEQAKLMMFTVYVPFGSFAASLGIVLIYKAWQDRRSKRYQKMDIHPRRAH